MFHEQYHASAYFAVDKNKKPLGACEAYSHSTSVSLNKEWIVNTITEAGLEAPTFIPAGQKLNPEDVACSEVLKDMSSLYFSLFTIKTEECDSQTITESKNELEDIVKECTSKYDSIVEFKTQCDYYANSNINMINHVTKKCETK